MILQSTPWASAVATSISYMEKLRSRVSDSSAACVTCGLPMNWRMGRWGLQSQPAALAAAPTSFWAMRLVTCCSGPGISLILGPVLPFPLK